jgi:hypothetical protein
MHYMLFFCYFGLLHIAGIHINMGRQVEWLLNDPTGFRVNENSAIRHASSMQSIVVP